jgi:hypothetical protein
MANLDGEKKWKKLLNSVLIEACSQYHHFNIFFDGPELNINNLSSLKDLKQLVYNFIIFSIQAILIKDLIYIFIFYFKLDDIPYFINNNFQCQGIIFYCLTLNYQGRENLYHTLIGAFFFFLVFRRLVVYIKSILKGVPLFKWRVHFTIKNMDKEVCILIKGIISKLKIINRLPKTLQ